MQKTPQMANLVDGDRVQELVRIIIDGKKAKRKMDILTWGMLSSERLSDVLKELEEINRKIKDMEQAELEFCTHAYHIVDNVILSFHYVFRNGRDYSSVREDLRQSLIIELYEILKRYDEQKNSSFAKYAFCYLRLTLKAMLFRAVDCDYESANEKRLRNVFAGNIVSYEGIDEDRRESLEGRYKPTIEDMIIRKEIRTKVRDAVSDIHDEDGKKLVELIFYKNKTRKEAARELGLDESQVLNLYRRTLKGLEKSLGKDASFQPLYKEYIQESS